MVDRLNEGLDLPSQPSAHTRQEAAFERKARNRRLRAALEAGEPVNPEDQRADKNGYVESWKWTQEAGKGWTRADYDKRVKEAMKQGSGLTITTGSDFYDTGAYGYGRSSTTGGYGSSSGYRDPYGSRGY